MNSHVTLAESRYLLVLELLGDPPVDLWDSAASEGVFCLVSPARRRALAMYAPISAPAPAPFPLEICSLANAVTLPLDPMMTAGQLRQIIAEKLGIAAPNQLWHVQGERLTFQDGEWRSNFKCNFKFSLKSFRYLIIKGKYSIFCGSN